MHEWIQKVAHGIMHCFFDLYVRGVSCVKRLPAFPSTPPGSAQVGLRVARRKCGEIGAGEEIRTPDQRLGKPMRYHCATPARSSRRKFILGRARNASQANGGHPHPNPLPSREREQAGCRVTPEANPTYKCLYLPSPLSPIKNVEDKLTKEGKKPLLKPGSRLDPYLHQGIFPFADFDLVRLVRL